MNQSTARLRLEKPNDRDAIRQVHAEAFRRPTEACIVEKLRAQKQTILSLVAEIGPVITAHLVLHMVAIMPTVPGLRMLGLGPVAVCPLFQGKGIGSMLIRGAIDLSRAQGWHAIVVLGQPRFYRRFGFTWANHFGLSCEFNIAAQNFLVLELQPAVLKSVSGVVRYQPEFECV